MIRENKYPVLDLIIPQNVLVSVFNKAKLEIVINAVRSVSPSVRFYSTGATGERVKAILREGSALGDYMSVEGFTGAPEMEGELVKTLHPKIHAGLLAERNNPIHEQYMAEELRKYGIGGGVYFDIFVGNLYPFAKAISEEGATAETARVNIDIGGPTMAMAGAKNWHSVAVITLPDQYQSFADDLKTNGGTTLGQRFNLAQTAFELIGDYRSSISEYFYGLSYEEDVKPFLKF